MDTLIVHVTGRGARGPSLLKRDRGTISLGRGFHNDIVLEDPYVDAEQLRFVRRDDTWFVEIVSRTNPVLINGSARHEQAVALKSGDQITVGRTDLSVYDESHPIDPPRHLAFSSWLSAHRVSPWLALAVLLAGGMLDAVIEFSFQSTDLETRKYAYGVLFSTVFISGWAALWALLGRAIRHQAHFFAHLLISAVVSFGMTLLIPLSAFAEITSSNQKVGEIVTYLLAAVGLSVLLGFNLFLATNLRRTARVALIFSACIASLVYIANHHEDERYQARPTYSKLVLPPFLHITGESSIDDFVASVAPVPDDD